MQHATMALFLCGLAASGLAAGAACSATQCSGQISRLYLTAGGDIYVALVGGLGGLTACTPVQGAEPYLTLLSSNPNLNQMYATLLAAQMAGRSLTLTVVPGSQGCTINYLTSP